MLCAAENPNASWQLTKEKLRDVDIRWGLIVHHPERCSGEYSPASARAQSIAGWDHRLVRRSANRVAPVGRKERDIGFFICSKFFQLVSTCSYEVGGTAAGIAAASDIRAKSSNVIMRKRKMCAFGDSRSLYRRSFAMRPDKDLGNHFVPRGRCSGHARDRASIVPKRHDLSLS